MIKALLKPRFAGLNSFSASLTLALAIATVTPKTVFAEAAEKDNDGQVDLSFRYRMEFVELDALTEDALASTLRTRLSWSAKVNETWHFATEFDNVSSVGDDDYNSGLNGNIDYPVVADPEGSTLNQFYLTWGKGSETEVKVGRHRITHDDHRFVGNVVWRQNEQTFDGLSLAYKPSSNFKLDLSHVFKINSIFGEDANLKGQFTLANAEYSLGDSQSLSAFFYLLDYDVAVTNSNQTLGVQYRYNRTIRDDMKFNFKLRYANQTDAGDNIVDYDVDYLNFEFKLSQYNMWGMVGNEIMGADNNTGFAFRLATLHKFNGYADVFLGTPAAGLNDTYVKVGYKMDKTKMHIALHEFKAEETDADYGTEVDIVVAHSLNEKVKLLGKFAAFSADLGSLSDVNKIWFMVNYDF